MFRSIFTTFGNCAKIPELKSRIMFTLGVLAVVRLIAWIRVPGLNGTALANYFDTHSQGGGMLGMYNTFAGGAMEHCAIGTMGIMPYISATIIIQLLTAVWPKLSKLAREEGGRSKIIQYGRVLTVLLCVGQGLFFAMGWENPEKMYPGLGQPLVFDLNHIWWYRIQSVLIMTTGTMLLMWLGEQITERGIGNGISLVITMGILARLPQAATGVKDMFHPSNGGENHANYGIGIVMLLLLVGVVAGVIAVTQAQRKIPVQYAQRAVGRKMYQGGTSFMPLKVNYAGVMPIIFAQSILMFPQPVFLGLSHYFSQPFMKNLFQDIAQALTTGTATVSDHVCADDPVLLLFLGGDAVQRNPNRR